MFASLSFNDGLLLDASALAVVALLGFLVGRRTRNNVNPPESRLADGLARAQSIAKELDIVTQRLRTEATAHQASIAVFQSQIRHMQNAGIAADWQKLGEHADALISPTMKLATNLTLAYDQLRSQQAQLITYSGSRIDRETGLHNRRSVEEQLAAFLSTHSDGRRGFAVALFSATSASGENASSDAENLRPIARMLEDCVRGNDFIARYSHDEFLVLMPKTTLPGALVFAERLLRLADSDLQRPLWGGVAVAACGESADKLLSRVDSALYSARTCTEGAIFQHTGAAVRRHELQLDAPIAPYLADDSSGLGGSQQRSECLALV